MAAGTGGVLESRKEPIVVIALSGGAWIFLGGVIAFLVGAVIAIYTRGGSGVDLHPYRHVHGGAPGADYGAHDYGGSDRTAMAEREVARKWRSRERPPQAPPEERAAEREREQRPKPGKGPSIRPPL
jgi:hypothetical protein